MLEKDEAVLDEACCVRPEGAEKQQGQT